VSPELYIVTAFRPCTFRVQGRWVSIVLVSLVEGGARFEREFRVDQYPERSLKLTVVVTLYVSGSKTIRSVYILRISLHCIGYW
jgi:hypothetical protein